MLDGVPLYNDLTLVSESVECLKGKRGTGKGVHESKVDYEC